MRNKLNFEKTVLVRYFILCLLVVDGYLSKNTYLHLSHPLSWVSSKCHARLESFSCRRVRNFRHLSKEPARYTRRASLHWYACLCFCFLSFSGLGGRPRIEFLCKISPLFNVAILAQGREGESYLGDLVCACAYGLKMSVLRHLPKVWQVTAVTGLMYHLTCATEPWLAYMDQMRPTDFGLCICKELIHYDAIIYYHRYMRNWSGATDLQFIC